LVISPTGGENTVAIQQKSSKSLKPENQEFEKLHINTECKKDTSGHFGFGIRFFGI